MLIVAIISSLLFVACDKEPITPQKKPSSESGYVYPFRTKDLIVDAAGKDSSDFWEDGLDLYVTENLISWAAKESGSITIFSDLTINDKTYKIEYDLSYTAKTGVKKLSGVAKIKQGDSTYLMGIQQGNIYFDVSKNGQRSHFIIKSSPSVSSIEQKLPLATQSSSSFIVRTLLSLDEKVQYARKDKISEYIAGVRLENTLHKFKSTGDPEIKDVEDKKAVEEIGTFIMDMSNTYFNTSLTNLDITAGQFVEQFDQKVKASASYIMEGEYPLTTIKSFYLDFYSPKSTKSAFSGKEVTASLSFYGLKKDNFDGDIFNNKGFYGSENYEEEFSLEKYKSASQDNNVTMIVDAILRVIDLMG